MIRTRVGLIEFRPIFLSICQAKSAQDYCFVKAVVRIRFQSMGSDRQFRRIIMSSESIKTKECCAVA